MTIVTKHAYYSSLWQHCNWHTTAGPLQHRSDIFDYCTILTNCSRLVMHDAHSSLALMFTTRCDNKMKIFSKLFTKLVQSAQKFFFWLYNLQFWRCSQVPVMCDKSQIGVQFTMCCDVLCEWSVDSWNTTVIGVTSFINHCVYYPNISNNE